MQTTGNLGLKKPEGTDIVDIADLNGNMDILDNAVTSKVDKVTGKQLSTNDYTTAEKTKLAGVAAGATNYTHPATHPPAIIAQDASNRFVTDAEKTAWNAKAGTAVATTATNGLMSAADKTLLNNNTGFGTTAGTATAYTLTLSPAPTVLIAGFKFSFKTHIASGANPTLNPNTLGAKAIKKPNGNAATLALNGVYTVVYDGTAFILQGEGGDYGTATAADVLAGKTIGTEGGLIDGAIVQRGATEGYTNSVSAAWAAGGGCWVRIPAGAYLKTTAVGNPEIRVTDPNVVPANWLRGVSMFGQDGAIVNRSVENNHSPSNAAEIWATGEVFLMPQAGYYNGVTWTKSTFPTLVPSNVRAGVSIGTLVGTLQPWVGGLTSVDFETQAGANGKTEEMFRFPAGFTIGSFAGSILFGTSNNNSHQDHSIVLQDIHGNRLVLIRHFVDGWSMSTTQQATGLIVDKRSRRITMPSTQYMQGFGHDGDIAADGSFSKPFNMDGEVMLVHVVVASLGGGYSTASARGAAVWN
ncbi:hypothetical protein NST74_26405 [Paenibacillus sp. FSL F4-0125]|uniref:hypothetical protein n=1 Tax=Paenibacillus sp. FSL F4-0125 TaxID=2954730 RepID=UPI0030F5F146